MRYLTKLFWIQFSVLATVGIFNGCAEYFSWYYFHPLLDVPMHFLGGAWVALVSYWVLRDVFMYTERQVRLYVFLLITVMFVGLAWEFFELFIHVIDFINVDIADSVKDLCMDFAGGAVVCVFIRNRMV